MISRDEDKPLKKTTSSILENIAYQILSWGISPDNAVYISEKFRGKHSQQGVMKVFIDELQNSFDVTGSTPDFLAKLIPEYIAQTLKEKMPAGEILRFTKELESDLTYAYDQSLDSAMQNRYKIRAFNTLMLQLGPHALKHIQSLRPKNSNSWVVNAIATAQSELPAIPVEEVEKELKQAFRERGSLEYVDNFTDHINIKKVLGAGTVGISALLEYKETPSSEPREVVAKIIRRNAVEAFLNDNKILNTAIDVLLKEKAVLPHEAESFKRFSLEKLYKELEETNPNLENAHLMQRLYEGPHITTVKSDLYLYGIANNVIFMEKAKGIELGKFLKNIRKKLADPSLSKEAREECHKQLFTLRKHYVTLTQRHLKRVAQNSPVHADLHAGNIFYDEEEELLSVLDLGAVSRPATKDAHLRLRQFLFSIYLTIGTGDVEYMRFFYKHHVEHPEFKHDKLALSEINHLLDQVKNVLAEMKNDADKHFVVNVDQGFNEIMSLISNKVLTAGISIVPNALVNLARSNQILNEELRTIDKDLSGTPYEKLIPYTERTQLAIALFAAMKDKSFKITELWTNDAWDHFVNQCLTHPGGIEQLSFEKKFIYGIFGLDDIEAVKMNFLIPGTVISGVAALMLGKAMIEKTYHAAKAYLPQLKRSYDFLSEAKKTYGEDFSKFYDQIRIILKEKNILTMKSISDMLKTDLLTDRQMVEIKPSTKFEFKAERPVFEPKTNIFYKNPFKQSSSLFHLKRVTVSQKRIPRNPTFFRRFLPGVIVGGALAYGVQQLQKK